MALVGHISMFDNFFARYGNLAFVQEYLHNALRVGSVENTRIMGLNLADKERIECEYDLGGGVRAIEQTYKLKSSKEAFFETHKKYVDFQLCVAGAEEFLIGFSEDFEILESYNEQKDLVIYHNPTIPPHALFFTSGTLGIFFPQDVHSGGLDSKNTNYLKWQEHINTPLKKSVLKVPIKYFL